MEHNRQPLVSIGVPVYNGERGLATALDCLLRQDYPRFEIIISDNGSEDGTEDIGRRYANNDARVKYFRSDVNRGAVWNFNRVFELSSGEYFMWAAHDDEREPEFVKACVERLEACPDAVLCQAYTAVSLRGSPDVLYIARMDSFEHAKGLMRRYRETLKRFPATAIYGVFRSSAMRKTRMWQEVIATDVAFIQELSIYGRFVQVPAVLFHYQAGETWNTSDQDARVFLGSAAGPRRRFPSVTLFLDHCRRLAAAPVSVGSKLGLTALLVAHEIRRVAARAFIGVAGLCCPGPKKEAFGLLLYNRMVRNPNISVTNETLFMTRVCKPQLRWWG
jgi:glycosyltransferase involved in cell wall biosynthesis